MFIKRFEFKEEDIELLIDESGFSVMFIGINIKKVFEKMVDDAEEGDVFYFYYSGYGILILFLKYNEFHRKDEVIVFCDFNFITG